MFQIRYSTILFAGGLALALAVLGAQPAQALGECYSGCRLETKLCITAARMVKQACKLECRETRPAEEFGGCKRGCVDAFRATKDTCREDRPTCVDACLPDMPGPGIPPIVDEACAAGCGEGLAECASGVISASRDCVRDCRTDPDPLGCMGQCAADAIAGGETCAAEFESCLGGCVVGSPSGAFLSLRD